MIATTTSNILVTGAGGAAGVAVLRDLVHHGHTVYAADCDPYAAGLYLVPERQRMLVPRGDDPSFPATLRDLAIAAGVDVVIPTVDEELEAIADVRPDFLAVGIELLLAPAGALATCLDKWALVAMLTDVIPVPNTSILDERFVADPGVFPVIVKPRRGRGGRGVVLVEDADQLRGCPHDGSHSRHQDNDGQRRRWLHLPPWHPGPRI